MRFACAGRARRRSLINGTSTMELSSITRRSQSSGWRHRVTPRAESQWWHPLNRSLDTDSTSGLSLLHKSRPHATTCWLVSDGGADGGPVPDHTAAPSAILSCGRLLNNVPRATLRHRATKACTEDTNGPHKNQLRLGLPPFEDRRPGRHSGIFNLQHRRLRKLQHSHPRAWV